MSATDAAEKVEPEAGGHLKRPAEEAPEGEPAAKTAAASADADAGADAASTDAFIETQAAPKQEYKLGFKTFTEGKEILAYFHDLLTFLPAGVLVNEYEHKALADLVRSHPRPRSKIKDGIMGFKKGGTWRDGAQSTCFFAVYKDGSEGDFSYLKCVANLTQETLQPRASAQRHSGGRGGGRGGGSRGGGRGARGRGGRGRGRGRGRRG